MMALDLIEQTRRSIADAGVGSLDDVRAAPRLVSYSAELLPELRVLKTFLRDNLYMDVLDDFAGLQGVLRGPASDGAVAAIARVDIARVAVTVLLEPAAHAGRIYELSGSQALTLTQVAQQLSEFSDRPVRYEPESVAEAFESRRALGAPDWQVEAWVSTYTAIAAGEMSTVTDTVERLTGIPPMTFAQFLTRSPE